MNYTLKLIVDVDADDASHASQFAAKVIKEITKMHVYEKADNTTTNITGRVREFTVQEGHQ